MESSAAADLHALSMEKDRMLAKHESDLALQDELFDKLMQELRSVNDNNLRELKAVVPSKLYRDIISPMAEKSFNYDKHEIEASHKKRVGLIEDKHTKALAQHEVLYQEKLKAALVNKSQPVVKPGSRPIHGESIDCRSDHVSLSEDVSTSLDGLESHHRPTPEDSSASRISKEPFGLCKPLSWTVQNEAICGERRLIMRVQSKKRKASTSEETHPKRLRVDTSVNQVRTPAPTPSNEPAHSPKRTITFDEVYQDGRAKHKDIIVEWPTGSRQWYILKCEQHGLRFTRNSIQGAAKHLNGNGHGRTDRNRDYAVKALGYLVTGCDENLAKLNNQVAEEAYAKGYKPPFPRLKKPRDPSKGSKKKQVGGRGLAGRPSVPHAANPVLGPPQEISSTPDKAAAKGHRESGGPSTCPKSSDSWGGITNPKEFHIYYGRWKDGLGKVEDRIYPVMILGWDNQKGSGLKDIDLNATGLLKKKAKPPNCYTYDSNKITGWAPGYEDGGSKIKFRKFPVMFFDESQTVGWLPARDLMKFPLNKRKAPAELDHPFNAARRWIAEREGFKTWEDRERARIGVSFTAHPPSVSPLTPAESADTASHNHHAEDDDSDDWLSQSEAASVASAVTEKMMRELREKGGEISGDEDYVASDSDVDASLDCEVDDWNRSSPSMARPDNTATRPWAFYGLRNTENTNGPKPSVDPAHEVQEKGPTVSSTADVDSACQPARQAFSSATGSHPYVTPGSAVSRPSECNPQATGDPDKSDKSRSYRQKPSNQAPIRDNSLAQIIAETLNFRNDVYNSSTALESRTFTSQNTVHSPRGVASRPIGDAPVQLSSANAVATHQGQIGEKISLRPTSKIVTEVSEASPTKDSIEGRLTRDDDLSRDHVNDTSSSDHATTHSMKSTIYATREINETTQRSQAGASNASKYTEGALHKVSMVSSSIQPLADVENAVPVVGLVDSAAKLELRSSDADFELSFYRSGDVSWVRTNEQEDCIQLFHDAGRKTVSTKQGPVAITIDPLEMIGFSREKDTILDSKGNTVLVLRHKNGSSSRLIFDRSKGSKLSNGKIQDRGFIKWLRTVKPDLACF